MRKWALQKLLGGLFDLIDLEPDNYKMISDEIEALWEWYDGQS